MAVAELNTMLGRHLGGQIISIAQRTLNGVLRRCGYRVSRVRALDLRAIADTPLQAAYLARVEPFLVNFPLQDCRILGAMAFACATHAGNPFVDTLLAYRSGIGTSYPASPLFQYYHSWRPSTALEILDLDSDQHCLSVHSPLAVAMPWAKTSPLENLAIWRGWQQSENVEHGLLLNENDGSNFHGPVSDARGVFEFSRLIQVYESIRSNGFVRSERANGDIRAVLLCNRGNGRALVIGGHHRIAALVALGYDKVPVRFEAIVRRDDVECWPNVCSGLFSESEGLQIFDRIFDARQPTGYQRLTVRTA